MKKILSLMLVCLMAALLLAGCGNSSSDAPQGEEQEQSQEQSQEPTVSVDSLKTMGDVLALDRETFQSALYDNVLVYAFELDGTYYRATTSISQDMAETLRELDFNDEKFIELVKPLAIEKMENLSEQILSQDELDALIGKTGQELLDEGWYSSGYNLETMEFWMNYEPFVYTVTFDGEVAKEDYESFDDEEDIKDLTVKSAKFMTLGEATNVETEAE